MRPIAPKRFHQSERIGYLRCDPLGDARRNPSFLLGTETPVCQPRGSPTAEPRYQNPRQYPPDRTYKTTQTPRIGTRRPVSQTIARLRTRCDRCSRSIGLAENPRLLHHRRYQTSRLLLESLTQKKRFLRNLIHTDGNGLASHQRRNKSQTTRELSQGLHSKRIARTQNPSLGDQSIRRNTPYGRTRRSRCAIPLRDKHRRTSQQTRTVDPRCDATEPYSVNARKTLSEPSPTGRTRRLGRLRTPNRRRGKPNRHR